MSARRLSRGLLFGAIAVSAAVLGHGCNLFPNFQPQSVVSTVRLLAVRADKPFATPGDTVTLDVLAADGRPDKPHPMKVSWLPVPCMNPENGAAVNCYPAFAEQFEPHVDLTDVLPSGDSLSFTVPADALGGTGGEPPRTFSRMVFFVLACAGHVEHLGKVPGLATDALPFGCFDEEGRALGPSDFMIAYANVYGVLGITNQNPVISAVKLDRQPVDPAAGITLPHCTTSGDEPCPGGALYTLVPKSSWEDRPISGGTSTGGGGAAGDTGAAGGGGAAGDTGTTTGQPNPQKESLWVEYYVTQGSVPESRVPVYDSVSGEVEYEVKYRSPRTPGEGMFYAVVRDDRGGVAWWSTPLHIQ
ncbi:MAG: hypothetical protein U0441_14145 [Polyangiaceae bacterium]